jgi:hypothetical protein
MTLNDAVIFIDEQFGKGYAARNPGLVGAMLQESALRNIADSIDTLVSCLGEINATAHPGNDIALAIDRLADVVEAADE